MWPLLNNKFSIAAIAFVAGLGIMKFYQPTKLVEIETHKETALDVKKEVDKKAKRSTHRVIPQAAGVAPIVEDIEEDISEHTSEAITEKISETMNIHLEENEKAQWRITFGYEFNFKNFMNPPAITDSYSLGVGHRIRGPWWGELKASPPQQRVEATTSWEF